MNFIERLQNKPRHIRVQMLWISVILVMSIILFFWLISLNYSFKSSELEQTLPEEKTVPSLFGTLKEDFSLFKKSLQAGIKGMLEVGKKEADFEVEIIK